MSPRLRFALECAYEAGRSTLDLFQNQTSFEQKADASPITEADRRAERMMRMRIGEKFPGESILGEEEGLSGDSSARWVMDPIDGTKSFVAGVPLYSTLLSFEQDGAVQVGVAYFPALDWMVYAERGQGAYANGRPISVSQETDLSRSFLCLGGHKSMELRGLSQSFTALSQRVLATRTWGDAYGHCLVASGRAQAMIDPVVAYYDISAVQLIVREAGGRFTDLKGNESMALEALSSNGVLHHAIVEALGA